MQAGKQVNIGLSTYFRAFGFIFEHGLAVYFIYPVILSVLLFVGGISFIVTASDSIVDYIISLTGLQDADSWYMTLLAGAITWLTTILLWILGWFINSWLTKYIVLILMSPVLAYVSEKTEKILTGRDYPFDFYQLIRDILRGILMALRNMFIELGVIIIFFFVGWIPLIGWIVSLVALSLFSWYFYGFNMIDYCNERKKMSVRQSSEHIRQHKWVAISNGLIYSLLFAIPYLGVVVAPITGAVAACLAVHEIGKGEKA
ncbi:MAG: EI24 domain-containing protein [Bacteroidota bacterium]|jgi:CysZ protein